MFIHEVDLDETALAQLIRFSEDWTEENSCYGYRPNDKSDIEGNRIFLQRMMVLLWVICLVRYINRSR